MGGWGGKGPPQYLRARADPSGILTKDKSRVYPFTGLDYWTGILDWTTGLTFESKKLMFQVRLLDKSTTLSPIVPLKQIKQPLELG